MPQFVRQTAMPCTLGELKQGAWVQNSETPSGVRTSRGLASRVSVIGVIVQKSADASFTVDDGTAALSVRAFDAAPKPIAAGVGELVSLIARPREYGGERYLVLEICKRPKDPRWAEYRKLELAHFSDMPQPAPQEERLERKASEPAPARIEVPETGTKNPFETIIERIRALDDGKGADVHDVLEGIAHAEKERLLATLVEEGEIFEIRPGRVKVLE